MKRARDRHENEEKAVSRLTQKNTKTILNHGDHGEKQGAFGGRRGRRG